MPSSHIQSSDSAQGHLTIGIDLGATNVKGVVLNDQDEAIRSLQWPKVDDPGADDHWQKVVARMVGALSDGLSIQGYGLSAPGLPNERNEHISYMPGRLQGLEHLDWAAFLKLDRVFVLNDAQAALMAEAHLGAGKGYRHIVMLTLGTGVGGGIMIDGQLYQGKGQRAGHLGHITVDGASHFSITGQPGSLENAIGNATVHRRSHGRYEDTSDLVAAYRRHEPWASYVWLQSVRHLAVGLSAICNAVSPEVIILGGGITNAGKDLFDPLSDFLKIYEWRPGDLRIPVVQAHFHEFGGAMGAASFAKTHSLLP